MDVSQALINTLADNDIDTLFGIPGNQTLPLNEAIGNNERVSFVVARHETAVSHQAWGYAETSSKTAATIVIPGPGDMNAMNGLKNALNDCTPMVHISIETDPNIRGGDGIHETPPNTYDTVVKENILVEKPEGILLDLQRGIDIARSPPKGPVRIGVPKSFLRMDVPLARTDDTWQDGGAVPAESAIDDAVQLLTEAQAPVILAGGGVRKAAACEALRRVAERLDAPIVTTYKGKGVVPDTHCLVAGTLSGSACPELLACLEDGDLLLAVGTDFDAVSTRSWSINTPDEIIHVTLSPSDLGTGYSPTVGIVGDCSDVLESLDEHLSDADLPVENGRNQAAVVAEGFESRIEPLLDGQPPITSVCAVRRISDVLPDDTIVTVDAGGFRVWALNVFRAAGPKQYVNPGSWATMGTGLPSGIGAQLSNPEADVVVLTGDGGLLMCLHELHTLVSEGLPVTVVVLNNSDYAIISEEANRHYDLPERAYGWSGAPIDFTRIADGMGLRNLRADSPAAIEEQLSTAVSLDEPILLEIQTDPAEPQASTWMAE